MTEPERKPQASLVQLRKGAGGIWWNYFVRDHLGEIARREHLVGAIYWTQSERMPIDLFSYIREASRCFTIARFLASITMASCAVELILNKDRRLRSGAKLRRVRGWATLNNANLIIAADSGLPSSSLCSAGESLQQVPPLVFVARRNRVAHGEVLPMLKTLSDYDIRAEEEALDQVSKAQKFVIEWFNGAPDVQEGSIANHRWPDA